MSQVELGPSGNEVQVSLGAAGLQPGWNCPFAASLLSPGYFPVPGSSLWVQGDRRPVSGLHTLPSEQGAAEAVADRSREAWWVVGLRADSIVVSLPQLALLPEPVLSQGQATTSQVQCHKIGSALPNYFIDRIGPLCDLDFKILRQRQIRQNLRRLKTKSH